MSVADESDWSSWRRNSGGAGFLSNNADQRLRRPKPLATATQERRHVVWCDRTIKGFSMRGPRRTETSDFVQRTLRLDHPGDQERRRKARSSQDGLHPSVAVLRTAAGAVGSLGFTDLRVAHDDFWPPRRSFMGGQSGYFIARYHSIASIVPASISPISDDRGAPLRHALHSLSHWPRSSLSTVLFKRRAHVSQHGAFDLDVIGADSSATGVSDGLMVGA